MRYAQIKGGLKLHLVYEAGEGISLQNLTPIGQLSAPLCGIRVKNNRYRATFNVSLGNACDRCVRIYSSRNKRGHII